MTAKEEENVAFHVLQCLTQEKTTMFNQLFSLFSQQMYSAHTQKQAANFNALIYSLFNVFSLGKNAIHNMYLFLQENAEHRPF